MKELPKFTVILAMLLTVGIVTSLTNCAADKTGTTTEMRAEIDSMQIVLKTMAAGEATLSKNLQTFDTLDYTVFGNQEWLRLHESHSQDIIVNWPDGHHTNGIERHIEDLKALFVYAPDTRIKQHPIRFGDKNGEWTCVTGVMKGTFTKPMPTGDGSLFSRPAKPSSCQCARWDTGRTV